MALEGTLKDFSLADILQLISLQKKTGYLTLRNPVDKVVLGFHEGKLVSAESSAKRMDTRLGTLLVKTRCLTPESLAKALEIQGQTLQRLGFILLKNGYCTAEDLRNGLDIQISKIAYGLFRWTDGEYVFDPHERIDFDQEFVTPITVESFLMEGARMQDEWPIIEKVVRSTEVVFERTPVLQPVSPAEADDGEDAEIGESTVLKRSRERGDEAIKVSRAEWLVYELVDGARTVEEIIERTFLADFEGAKAFYDLVNRGLIAEVRHGQKAFDSALSVEIPAARNASFLAATALVVAAAILLAAFSIPLQVRNPLNAFPLGGRPPGPVLAYRKAVALLALRRLAGAVEAYAVARGGEIPESADALIKAGYLKPADLQDLHGRAFGFQKGESLVLYGRGHDGKTDADLFITRRSSSVEPGAKGGIVVLD